FLAFGVPAASPGRDPWANTQSTSCRVRTSSTATAWPIETLFLTCRLGAGGEAVLGAGGKGRLRS
uniref:Uncharacterized protein n=1 Tax=Sus scrofa TaxID=9823 RepID=A0A8W4FAJ4_PIG